MQTNRLSVLVTGATGFLGSHILKTLITEDEVEVIAACRNPDKLPVAFKGEVRQGDLRDPEYRRAVVQDVDVICHAGTWASMWGNARHEQEQFYQPCIDLIEQSISAGVKRFLMTSTVVMAARRPAGEPYDDFSPTVRYGFWNHLDRLVEIDDYMKTNARRGMQMTCMRLGHFVGMGNRLGIVPVLLPRLRTYLVPWLAGGTSRMPLISGEDMGRAYAAVSCADDTTLLDYESFNITGTSFPTVREVFSFICQQSGAPRPWYSAPYSMGMVFGWLMEALFPVLPGKAPFLTRSVVHLAKDWQCPADYVFRKTGFRAQQDWKQAITEAIDEIEERGAHWPPMAQRE